jgi:hypothetical protein
VPQVLYSIPGADITNNPSLLATFVLNLIFIFGLLVRPSKAAVNGSSPCRGIDPVYVCISKHL